MSKFPLDLAKFKKVSTDKDKTTLQHTDGHTLTINHGSLDAGRLKALNGLPILEQEAKLPAKRFADGGDTGLPSPAPNVAPEPVVEQPVAEVPVAEAPVAAAAPVDAAPMAAEQPIVEEPAKAQAAPAEPKEAPKAPEKATESPQEVFKHEPSLFKDPAQGMQYLAKEDAALASDLAAGHIQPQTMQQLFADKSTLGKIGTLFGMIVGGAGAGLTHQENPVLAAMRQQITNDLEAQKANIGNKQTLLSMNRQRFPDLESAVNFTRMQQNRMYLDNLTKQVQQLPLGSPQRAQAEKSLAMVGQFVNTDQMSLQSQIASKQAFMSQAMGQSQGDEQAYQAKQNMFRMSGNPALQHLAESNDEHHMPGLGTASVKLSPENRETLQSKSLLDQKLQNFITFAQKNSGSVDPRVRAAGKAMAAELSGLYRQATHGGVYKEGEADFINQLIDANPTKFFNTVRGVIPKAQELMRSNNESLDSYKKSLGFASSPKTSAPPSGEAASGEIQRRDPKSGKIAIFDSNKKFLRWQ